MAKQEKHDVVTIWVPANEVYWLPRLNFGRHNSLVDNTAKQNEHAVLISSLGKDALPGTYWASKEAIPVCLLQDADGALDYIGTVTEVSEAILALKGALSGTHPEDTFPTVPTPTKLNDAQLREGFNALFFPNGELHIPKYEGIACFQRGMSVYKAVALLIASGMKPEEAVSKMRLPVEVTVLRDKAHRISICGFENTMKDTGRTSIMNHWPSLFKLGKGLFDAKGGTATQSAINTLINGGVVKDSNKGIKVHSLLLLDQRFPNLGISSKILDAGVDKDGVDLGQKFAESIDRTTIWKYAQWLDSAKFQTDLTTGNDQATIRAAAGFQGSTGEEEVADYLADPASFKDVAVQMASKAVVNTRMTGTPNLVEKYILNAVATGRMERLSKLNAPAMHVEDLTKMNAWAFQLGLVDEKGSIVP